MKNKRILAWALFLALTVGLFSACSSQSPTETQQLPDTVPTTAAPAEPTQAPEPTETQPPQTEAPTQPVQTEAPPQPTEPEPVLLELAEQERWEINIFLSNFSEQWFHESCNWDDHAPNEVFYADTGSIAEIVDFVWLYAKLNRYSEMEHVDIGEHSYYAFKLSVLDPIAKRFFGRTLTEAELGTMESEYHFLMDGMICGPAADGETYMNMAVTEQMYDLGDGTMRVEFTIYDTWDLANSGDIVDTRDLYYLTGEQARNTPDLKLHLKGTAVVRPQTLDNGRESYQLVSYELYDPAP